jgi:hypothetical protein
MSRAMLARITKLEARCESGRTKTFHQLWARPDMDAQQQAAAMIAAGQARESDIFLVRSIVEPSEDGPRPVYLPEPEWWSR